MKKIYLIIGLIGIVLVSVGYIYLTAVRPKGFESKREVTESYISNLSENDICEEHFTPDTIDICEVFANLLHEDTVVIKSSTDTQDSLQVILTINGVDSEFEFHFVETENEGLEGVFNRSYFLISYIE